MLVHSTANCSTASLENHLRVLLESPPPTFYVDETLFAVELHLVLALHQPEPSRHVVLLRADSEVDSRLHNVAGRALAGDAAVLPLLHLRESPLDDRAEVCQRRYSSA